MAGQSNKRKASQSGLGMMVSPDFSGDIEGQVIIKDLQRSSDLMSNAALQRNSDLMRNAVLQRNSVYHKALDVRVQSSTAASTLGGSEEKESLSFLEKHGTQMVDIYVGEEKILFRVYKDILCNKIEFFDRMFNGKFKEAIENTAVLPEDYPEAFDMLMSWVTYDKIRSLRGQDFRKKMHLWVLADKLCLADLQNYVMDIWRGEDEVYETYYTAEEFQYIFEKTASKSPPREYAARMLRFQSLQPPTDGLEYSIDSCGEPIPLSDVDAASLMELLANNKEMLETYLELSRRANNASGNEMDPRSGACLLNIP